VPICQLEILPSFSSDQRLCLDFTIPSLFNVKGKTGAYENLVRAQKFNKQNGQLWSLAVDPALAR
jgi:hypothetical protein